jgi:hypothetical protein
MNPAMNVPLFYCHKHATHRNSVHAGRKSCCGKAGRAAYLDRPRPQQYTLGSSCESEQGAVSSGAVEARAATFFRAV